MASVDELRTEQKEIEDKITELNAEYAGERFSEEAKAKWNDLNSDLDDKKAQIAELEAREERLRALADDSEKVVPLEAPQGRRPGVVTGDAIYDLSTIRRDFSDPTIEGRELRDRALRSIEDSDFPLADRKFAVEDMQRDAELLLRKVDTLDGVIARRMLVTGSADYKRAWSKYISGDMLTSRESAVLSMGSERAMSLTTTAGGFAVPYVLDPTVIPTSNLSVNPWRAIANVKQIAVDTWKGVSSAGVTAVFRAEATEETDSNPVFAQPSVSTEMARCFVPFSIEIGMDWGSLGSEVGRIIGDAKDDLEASKFALGSGTNEPLGVVTAMSASMYTAAATNAIVYADFDGLEAALGPRFRARASIVANRAVYQKIRHFDTSGGTGIWEQGRQLGTGLPNNVPTPGNLQHTVLGYPAYECSAMSSTFTTGQLLAVLGDFSGMIIVDRIGLTTEVIPHLFGTTANYPTGQRGIFAYWRTGSGTVSTSSHFKVLKLA